MNKLSKIVLAILGGIDAVFYIFTPIILAVVWLTIRGLASSGSSFFFSLGLLATIFRAFKIGWMK